jgi:lipopolysaccharide transport system ATP-binding protein
MIVVSAVAALALLVGGAFFFRRMEPRSPMSSEEPIPATAHPSRRRQQLHCGVAHLGKQYQIGARATYRTIREALVASVRGMARSIRRGSTRRSQERFWALSDVSFDVAHGDVIGIIGRNGSGKSTLLKILSRIVEPTRGEAHLRGRVASLLEVGTGFHPDLTGRENVYLSGAILGMRRTEIAQKFDEIVDFAEVDRFIDTQVKHYSSGMYLRLAFAVAAHLEPDILIVDEVLAVGDAAFQKKCLGKMGTVARHGRTVLFVSHNMGAVVSLCSRALLLDAGRLLLESDPITVAARYQATLTAAPSATTDLAVQSISGRERHASYHFDSPQSAATAPLAR